jgi:predicted permease
MLPQILNITLPIFIIALVGLVYGRRVKPDLGGANKLAVDIALPVLIFTSLSNKAFRPLEAAQFSVAAVVLIGLSGLLAWPFCRWLKADWRAILPCVMFVNVGPVGLPLMALSYGTAGLAAAVVLLVLSNLLHFTLGASLMSGRVDWRMVWANPLVWASLAGLGFGQLHWELPAWLLTPLTMIGQVLVPLMLLSLGVRLSSSQLSEAAVGFKTALLSALIRLFLAWLITTLWPLPELYRGALILFACLPAAVFNFLLADRFEREPGKVASIVMAGHVASLLVLPLGLWLALR